MSTPVLEGREVIGCNVCELRLPPGSDGHSKDIDCIKALRMVNKQQHEAASRLAISLSTRYYAIFEELVHDPECGIMYYTRDEETGEKTHRSSQAVMGIMAAIFKKFQEMGDWSPMERLQKELGEEQKLNVRMQSLLAEVEQLDGRKPSSELVDKIGAILHPDEQGQARRR